MENKYVLNDYSCKWNHCHNIERCHIIEQVKWREVVGVMAFVSEQKGFLDLYIQKHEIGILYF